MSVQWGAGLHTSSEGRVDAAAYEQYIGRWSRLFVPALLDAAEVGVGDRVLDVATGSGERQTVKHSRSGTPASMR